MEEDKEEKRKTKLPIGVKKQRLAVHSHFGKYCAWAYIAFAFFTIATIIKPSGGEQTVIHSNRHDVDIIYNKALTKEELPRYDPVVWERDHVKSEDFTIKYIDQSGWDYDRYRLSSMDFAMILMIPVLFVGGLQVLGSFAPERKIKRVIDFSKNTYFSKRNEIREEKGYIEITIFDAYKIPFLGIYWLRNIGYTVRCYSKLVLMNKLDYIVINGRIVGYDVVIEKRGNYERMIEAMIELKHEKRVVEEYEALLQNSYGIPARTVEQLMGLIENIVKATQRAEGDKKKEAQLSQKAVKEVMKIIKISKGMDTSGN